jgi:hypothetical protein
LERRKNPRVIIHDEDDSIGIDHARSAAKGSENAKTVP